MPAVLSKFVKPPLKKVPSTRQEFASLSRKDQNLYKEFVFGPSAKNVHERVDGNKLLLAEQVKVFGENHILHGWEFVNETREMKELDWLIAYGKALFDVE